MTSLPSSNPSLPVTPELILDYWYQALEQEIGIWIDIPNIRDTAHIRNVFYSTRRELGDERLMALSMHFSAKGDFMCIYKRTVEELDE